MKLIQVTEPTLPISLEEVKTFLRVLHSEDDTRIQSLISSVAKMAMEYTNRQIGVATFELYLDDVGESIALPRSPIGSLDGFDYFDGNTWVAMDYKFDDKSTPPLVYPEKSLGEDVNKYRLQFTAGYSTLPPSFKNWMLLKIEELYDGEVPKIDITPLLSSYRIANV